MRRTPTVRVAVALTMGAAIWLGVASANRRSADKPVCGVTWTPPEVMFTVELPGMLRYHCHVDTRGDRVTSLSIFQSKMEFTRGRCPNCEPGQSYDDHVRPVEGITAS